MQDSLQFHVRVLLVHSRLTPFYDAEDSRVFQSLEFGNLVLREKVLEFRIVTRRRGNIYCSIVKDDF